MYVEWRGDPDHLRHVGAIVLKADEGYGLLQIVSGELTATLYMGPEKDAQAVFQAIRKRLGLNGDLITDKWIKKTVKNRWKGND